MHQKKSDLQIREESSSLSSDFSSTQPVFHPPIQTQYQSNPHESRNHLKIQIPSRSSLQHPSSIFSPPTQQNFNRTQFHNQPIFNNPSTNKTLLSTPHKRSILSQTRSSLSYSPTLSSLHHYHNTTVSNSEPSQPSRVRSSSCAEELALATKTISLLSCQVASSSFAAHHSSFFAFSVLHYHKPRNGDSYTGEYFADKMHGFGLYRFGNGHCYEGAWHEGRSQGLGLYTFSNGETQSGHWQNGVINVSSIQGTLPGSSFAISHSKVLNAVQEARRAAERAVNVAKVDERLNKAVAAANKAANAARVAAVKAVQNQMHHDNADTYCLTAIKRGS